jgi:hypothetical protein
MRLTTTDAFFVAYQAQTGVQMHFGAEIELAGQLERAAIETSFGRAIARWPALGQTLRRGLTGLAWRGPAREVITESHDRDDVVRWRNAMVDPFRESPFHVLWVRGERDHTLAFRCHHACADGQLFFAIVSEILCGLGSEVTRVTPPSNGHPLALRTLWPKAKLGPMWQHTRELARESKQDRSARIAASVAPGEVATHHRLVAPRAVEALASAAHVRSPWLVLAAWLQALHAWNAARGDTNPVFSVEVPVGLRRGPHAMAGTGNHLSVLTLFGDPRLPVGELARALWRDYAGGIRRGAHLAVPLFSGPLRVLPWPLFRRVAMTQTGFATTHFTWLAHDPDPRAEVPARSGGALAITDHRIYTPVCLRMGAALAVLAWRDELRLTITHRLAGVSAVAATELGERLVAKLA